MSLSRDNEEQTRELGSLAHACVRTENTSLVLRAIRWHNMIARLGVDVPLFIVHDVGLLFAVSEAPLEIAPPAFADERDAPSEITVERWCGMLRAIAESELAQKARAIKMQDELIAVLLLRAFTPLVERVERSARRRAPTMVRADTTLIGRVLEDPVRFTDGLRNSRFLHAFTASPLRLVLTFEQIDHDTLRLLGTLGKDGARLDAMGLLDLMQVLETPEANDVVNFSLDLLPSVLETKRATGRQAFSIDGYAGLERKGTVDSLMLSELAYDEELFVQRFLENEVFYYARDKQSDDERALHYICVDASASMRGQRATFARGLSLALAKKLTLQGERVIFRFFDGCLYEPLILNGTSSTSSRRGLDIPYILGFRGERGRNYTQVFASLAQDVSRRVRLDGGRPIVYLLTHSECHAPLLYVQHLAAVAQLYGIFIMPSSGSLDLEYTSLLSHTHIVNESVLNDRKSRAQRALDIVDDVASRNSRSGS